MASLRMASHTNMTATPEIVHAPVVELATLVDHPATSLLVLKIFNFKIISFLDFKLEGKKLAPFCSGSLPPWGCKHGMGLAPHELTPEKNYV